MKKSLIAVVLFLAVSVAHAGPSTVRIPTPSAPAPDVRGQIVAALSEHATFAVEYRRHGKSLILSDNVVEAGRIGGRYVFALDLGLSGATLPDESPSAILFTSGVRVNLNALVADFVPLRPEWTFVNHLEYYGRGFYDWNRREWLGSLNVGYGFGPGSGQ